MRHKYFDHAGNAEVLQVSSETVLRDWRMAKNLAVSRIVSQFSEIVILFSSRAS